MATVSELARVEPELLARARITEWEGLPGWTAPGGEAAAMHDCDVSRALAAGLACRPVEQTVADTWEWLREIPAHLRPPIRPGSFGRRGLSAEQEQMVWWLLGR